MQDSPEVLHLKTSRYPELCGTRRLGPGLLSLHRPALLKAVCGPHRRPQGLRELGCSADPQRAPTCEWSPAPKWSALAPPPSHWLPGARPSPRPRLRSHASQQGRASPRPRPSTAAKHVFCAPEPSAASHPPLRGGSGSLAQRLLAQLHRPCSLRPPGLACSSSPIRFCLRRLPSGPAARA